MSSANLNDSLGVVFTNQPKLSEHAIDEEHNARRVALVPHIARFAGEHARLKDQSVQISFFHTGISSLVCLFKTEREKLVFKIRIGSRHREGEGAFLRAWEKSGATVPKVFEEGVIDEHPYLLMEHIEAPTLMEAVDAKRPIEHDIFRQMGVLLRTMHGASALGYGRMVDGKAEFENFEGWLKNGDIRKKIEYVREHVLLPDTIFGSLKAALKILSEHVSGDPRSVYGHNDFSPPNIFATTPLTVFDPDPMFHHPYVDLARSIILISITGVELGGPSAAMTEGYFSEDASFDQKTLRAGVLLQAHLKFPYWHSTKQIQRIERVQEYLKAPRLF
jgi:hypothetical protein